LLLQYNYFRDYDSATGRYVESDPIGLDGGLNTFGYVEATPIVLVDPNGQRAQAVKALIAAARGGARRAKTFWDDLNFDGPNPGLPYGNGRVCQIRYKKQPAFRLDYQPIPGSKGEPRLHAHFGSSPQHFSLDPRSLND
jgi:uncharacterized protein RhaS with RHS repeats